MGKWDQKINKNRICLFKGTGKTTFAKFFLRNYPDIKHYLNADILVSGIAPLKPELVAVEAGRRLRKQMSHLAELIFLSLPSPVFAIDRVRQRVKQGGHNIPADVIRRRHSRGIGNLPAYKKLVNSWQVYDNSVVPMILLEEGNNENKKS
jgi:predicted ABC-type ATPase